MNPAIYATRNRSKGDEAIAFFARHGIPIFLLSETNIQGEAREDDNTTLQTNARKKVFYVQARAEEGRMVIGDDTGIFFDALNGAPGVNTAYWAGRDATTDEITQHALKQMESHDERRATFICWLVVLDADGTMYDFVGRAPGTLLREPRGESKPDMPFSPIFVPDGQEKTFAEMTPEEESLLSHRGKAFEQVVEFLKNR